MLGDWKKSFLGIIGWELRLLGFRFVGVKNGRSW